MRATAELTQYEDRDCGSSVGSVQFDITSGRDDLVSVGIFTSRNGPCFLSHEDARAVAEFILVHVGHDGRRHQ